MVDWRSSSVSCRHTELYYGAVWGFQKLSPSDTKLRVKQQENVSPGSSHVKDFYYEWYFCVSLCACMLRCMHTCEPVKTRGLSRASFLRSHPLVWPGTCQIGEAGWLVSPRNPHCCRSSTGSQVHTTTPGFLCGCWGIKLGSSWLNDKHFTDWSISLACVCHIKSLKKKKNCSWKNGP